MNSRFPNTPEVIASVSTLKDGEEFGGGDRVVGIQAREVNGVPVIELDIREFKRSGGNITVEIELAELVQAIALATFNAEKE